MNPINDAASLGLWLIEKGKPRSVAVIIACNKYKLPFSTRKVVSKHITHLRKHPRNQLELL